MKYWSALLLCLHLVIAGFALSGAAWGQSSNPLGVPGQQAPVAPHGGFWGETVRPVLVWIYGRQHQLQQSLTVAVKQFRADPAALWWLLMASFLYGVFHAAGPGHGKAILSSYMLANERQVRRGVLLALAAAIVQACSAIALVLVLALAINATGHTISRTANQLEIASYALIVAFGIWLLWRKGRACLRSPAAHAHHHHDHTHTHAHTHAHACDNHDHGHDDHHCGHMHMPAPETLSGSLSPGKAASLIFAMGLRPCTGAILVLLFALAQGVFIAGIGATFAMAMGTAITVATLASLALGAKHVALALSRQTSDRTSRLHGMIELMGALLVLLFGALLLAASLQGGSPF